MRVFLSPIVFFSGDKKHAHIYRLFCFHIRLSPGAAGAGKFFIDTFGPFPVFFNGTLLYLAELHFETAELDFETVEL